MTEGSCEKALLDVLIEKSLFFVSIEDLFYEQVFQARQIDLRLLDMISQLPIEEKITIIRVGDKLNDTLEIDKDLSNRIDNIEKVCTKPEFEILHIIYQNKYKDFLKVKSTTKPCDYLKSIDDNYRKTYRVNYDYFSKMKEKDLLSLIEMYCKLRNKIHKKDEKSLSDLLRKK